MKVLYPGSFDPITKGHMDIIEQATELFDEVIIALLDNPMKKDPYFSKEERLDILNEIYGENPKVKIIASSGSSIDIALSYKCKAIVRGLRSMGDFEYEMQLAQLNRDISDDQVNTICLFAKPNLKSVSSSAVKEIFNLGKNISKYVDSKVEEKMTLKKRNNR